MLQALLQLQSANSGKSEILEEVSIAMRQSLKQLGLFIFRLYKIVDTAE
jgi:hypothetical protein